MMEDPTSSHPAQGSAWEEVAEPQHQGQQKGFAQSSVPAAKHQPSLRTTASGIPVSLPMRLIKHNFACTEVQLGEQSQGKLGAGEQGWLQGSPSCLDPKPFGMPFWEFNIISASSNTPFPQGLCTSLLGNT